MTYDQLIKHYGTQAAAAQALGLSQPSVWAWKDRTIPYDRQCQIQVATNGKLKAKLEDDGRK
jgi:DNA-binding transcriptional regulator YdaS (Cro superfamily)